MRRVIFIAFAIVWSQAASSQTPDLASVETRPAFCLSDAQAEMASATSIIESSDSRPQAKARALDQRASLHFLCGRDVDAAVTDLSAALSLTPNDPVRLRVRAAYLITAGRASLAKDDLDAAMMLTPKEYVVRRARGMMHLHLAQYQEAAAELRTALLLDPAQPYAALELHIARLHLREPDAEEFADNTARFGGSDWPAPILAYYRGEIAEDEVVRLAGLDADMAGAARRCEAAYYIAHVALVDGDVSRARELFQQSADQCPFDSSERGGSLAELSRLN